MTETEYLEFKIKSLQKNKRGSLSAAENKLIHTFLQRISRFGKLTKTQEEKLEHIDARHSVEIEIPDELIYTGALHEAYYGYPCFECKIKDNTDKFRFVIGLSYEKPHGSIKTCSPDELAAIVYRCPACGRIYWLHCCQADIRAYQRYRAEKEEERSKREVKQQGCYKRQEEVKM